MMTANADNSGRRIRIVHFVTGGGSGATRVAVDIALAQQAGGAFEPLLLLRRKKNPLSETIKRQLGNGGVMFRMIEDRWPKWRTVSQIKAACEAFRPRIFVAHGNSEHLWGRKAAIAAGVPRIVHVEHNLEKYSPWRRWQAARLARRTDATVCVSEAVAARVREIGIASANTQTILNGTDIARYATGGRVPLAERRRDIVMAARFARQKDHATLIRAACRLAGMGWRGKLILAGGGKAGHRKKVRRLVDHLKIGAQVEFRGFVEDMPAMLRSCRVSVLSTFYEGLPLSLAEAMAAHCVVVASDAPGVRDVISDGETGFVFPVGDDTALADMLWRTLEGDAEGNLQAVADAGHTIAVEYFNVQRMVGEYNALLKKLA